jgi:hypothetical protein
VRRVHPAQPPLADDDLLAVGQPAGRAVGEVRSLQDCPDGAAQVYRGQVSGGRIMIDCPSPPSFDTLVDYWSRALSDEETAAVDEHLFGCEVCTERSGKIAALVRTLGKLLTVVISRGRLDQLLAAGARVRDTLVEPGERPTAVFSPGIDYLIHHLRAPLDGVRRVDCVVSAPDGRVINDLLHVPFDAERGEVIIACQRHYLAAGMDTHCRLTTFDDAGASQVREYTVLHVMEG